MLNKLTKNDLNQLQHHLIVPLAVADILHHNLHVELDMQYGLHTALSEIDPDSAMLAIALCARDIAEKCIHDFPIAAALQKEANEIITEYGPTWLHHYKNAPIRPEAYEAILETVPEDLEAMADLMDALCGDIGNDNETICALATLLSIQARAHMEIANFVLEEIEREKLSNGETEEGALSLSDDLIDMKAYKESNIVLFPTG